MLWFDRIFFGNLTEKKLFFAASKNSWICTSSTTTSQAFLKDQIFLTKGQACYRIMTSFCEIDGLIQRRESEVLFCLFPVVLSQINLIGWQLAMKIESFNFRPSFLGLRGSFRSFECVTMREENCMIKCFWWWLKVMKEIVPAKNERKKEWEDRGKKRGRNKNSIWKWSR